MAGRSSSLKTRPNDNWQWPIRGALVCCLLLFWYLDRVPSSSYLGFAKLAQTASCGGNEPETIQVGSSINECSSDAFEVLGNIIELEYRGDTRNVLSPPTVRRVQYDDREPIILPYTANEAVGGVWRRARVEVPEDWVGSLVAIDWGVVNGTPLEVRPRANFFQREFVLQVGWPVHIGMILVLSTLLVAWNLLRPSVCEWIGGSLLVVCALFVREGHYFYLDEWHILELYFQEGWGSLFLRHNEHLIPAFKLFYLSQVVDLALSYHYMLIISAALHVLNGGLLLLIGYRLFPEARGCVRGVVGIFLVNALNVFNLSWAFQQSILLCGVTSLFSSWAALRYVLDGGKLRWLIASLAATFVSPFFFGAGLATGTKVLLIAAGGALIVRGWCGRQMLCLAVGIVIVSGLSAYLYMEGGGSGLSHLLTRGASDTLIRIAAFTGIGIVAGSLLRFVGLFPVANDEETILLVLRYARPMLQGEVSGGVVLWLVAVAVFAALVVFTCLRPPKARGLVPITTGVLLVGISLLLPAIGRQQFGLLAAMMLRYHYLTADGILLFYVPMAVISMTILERYRISIVATPVAVGIVAMQIYHIGHYEEFAERAGEVRSAIATQLDWKAQCGSGTKCGDKHRPTLPFQFPPHFTDETLLAVYERLDRSKDKSTASF